MTKIKRLLRFCDTLLQKFSSAGLLLNTFFACSKWSALFSETFLCSKAWFDGPGFFLYNYLQCHIGLKEFKILVPESSCPLLRLLMHACTRKNLHPLALFSKIVFYVNYLNWGFITCKTCQFTTIQGNITKNNYFTTSSRYALE